MPKFLNEIESYDNQGNKTTPINFITTTSTANNLPKNKFGVYYNPIGFQDVNITGYVKPNCIKVESTGLSQSKQTAYVMNNALTQMYAFERYTKSTAFTYWTKCVSMEDIPPVKTIWSGSARTLKLSELELYGYNISGNGGILFITVIDFEHNMSAEFILAGGHLSFTNIEGQILGKDTFYFGDKSLKNNFIELSYNSNVESLYDYSISVYSLWEASGNESATIQTVRCLDF